MLLPPPAEMSGQELGVSGFSVCYALGRQVAVSNYHLLFCRPDDLPSNLAQPDLIALDRCFAVSVTVVACGRW